MDINYKSVYMYKAVGEKMKLGPVWDFDWSALGADAWIPARNLYKDNYEGLRSTDNWFSYLYSGSPEFRKALSDRYSELRANIIAAINEVESGKNELSRAAEKDWLMWHAWRVYPGYDKRFDELISWCKNRILWLDEAFIR